MKLVPIISLLACASASAQVCQPRWDSAPFTGRGNAMCMTHAIGPDQRAVVYVGGDLQPPNAPATLALRWWPDTNEWESINTWTGAPAGVTPGFPSAMAVLPENNVPIVYATGNGLWKLVGAEWQFVTSIPTPQGRISHLITFDDGAGPALYAVAAGCQFTLADGSSLIARWTGQAWENPTRAVGQRLHLSAGDCIVDDIAVSTGGGGTPPSLIISARTLFCSGCSPVFQSQLAELRAGSWQPLTTPVNASIPVADVIAWTDGPDPVLFAAQGPFLFRRSAGTWSPLPMRAAGGFACLAKFNDGSGTFFFASGSNLDVIDSSTDSSTARWNGSFWSLAGTDASRLYSRQFGNLMTVSTTSGGPRWLIGLFPNQVSFIRACPTCPADFDGSGAANVDDLFGYLQAWFALTTAADIDGVAGVAEGDLFLYLRSWWLGCP